jgi:hypothetical protein
MLTNSTEGFSEHYITVGEEFEVPADDEDVYPSCRRTSTPSQMRGFMNRDPLKLRGYRFHGASGF